MAAAFHELLGASSLAIAEAAEDMPTVIDDISLVRPAILRTLREKPPTRASCCVRCGVSAFPTTMRRSRPLWVQVIQSDAPFTMITGARR